MKQTFWAILGLLLAATLAAAATLDRRAWPTFVGDEATYLMEAQSLAERDIPEYVSADGTDKATFVRVPTLDEVPYPVRMEPNLVVEFYSR